VGLSPGANSINPIILTNPPNSIILTNPIISTNSTNPPNSIISACPGRSLRDRGDPYLRPRGGEWRRRCRRRRHPPVYAIWAI